MDKRTTDLIVFSVKTVSGVGISMLLGKVFSPYVNDESVNRVAKCLMKVGVWTISGMVGNAAGEYIKSTVEDISSKINEVEQVMHTIKEKEGVN